MATTGLLLGMAAVAGLVVGDGRDRELHSTNVGLSEIRCTAAGCQSAASFTPMEVRLADGGVTLCAYSACFEGQAQVLANGKSNLIVGSTPQRVGGREDAALLMLALDPGSGSGTMLWNGFANPLRCTGQPAAA